MLIINIISLIINISNHYYVDAGSTVDSGLPKAPVVHRSQEDNGEISGEITAPPYLLRKDAVTQAGPTGVVVLPRQ